MTSGRFPVKLRAELGAGAAPRLRKHRRARHSVGSRVYLTPFDHAMTKAGFRLTRWADDFVVVCPTYKEAERALAIPTARAKAEQVFALVDAGKTKAEVAEELGISIRSVFRILRTRKDAEKAPVASPIRRTRTRPQASAQ